MEFRIPDLIRIWDSLFALMADNRGAHQTRKSRTQETDAQVRDFLVDVCCAMVLMKRGELLSSEVSRPISSRRHRSDSVDIMVIWLPLVLDMPGDTPELLVR